MPSIIICLSLLVMSGCSKTETQFITPWFKVVRETSDLKISDANINRHVATAEFFILRNNKWIKLKTSGVRFVAPDTILVHDREIVHEKDRALRKICDNRGRLRLTPKGDAFDCVIITHNNFSALQIKVNRLDLHGNPKEEFDLNNSGQHRVLRVNDIWAYDDEVNPYFLLMDKDAILDPSHQLRDCALIASVNGSTQLFSAEDNASASQCESTSYWTKIVGKGLSEAPSNIALISANNR